jgi:hypothetical protein
VNKLYRDGYAVINEFQVKTPGGMLQNRYVNKAVFDVSSGEPVAFYLVGRITRGGIPVAREMRAINDILDNSLFSYITIIFRPNNAK